MNLMWLLRAKRWAQHPPSMRKVIAVAIVVGACLSLYLLERWGLLPDWMAAERLSRGRVLR